MVEKGQVRLDADLPFYLFLGEKKGKKKKKKKKR